VRAEIKGVLEVFGMWLTEWALQEMADFGLKQIVKIDGSMLV
jgi:hypothetical protein